MGTEHALARLGLDYFEQKEVQPLGLFTSSPTASGRFTINLNGIYAVHWIWECVNQCASLKLFQIPLFSQLKHFIIILSLNYLGNLHHFSDKCAMVKTCWLKQILLEWYKNWQLIRSAYFALQMFPLLVKIPIYSSCTKWGVGVGSKGRGGGWVIAVWFLTLVSLLRPYSAVLVLTIPITMAQMEGFSTPATKWGGTKKHL